MCAGAGPPAVNDGGWLQLPPRLVVAGTASGAGKTTVATGLMAAFGATGRKVASAKVGPDFIDPGYHRLATGRPGANLDPWMCGERAIGPLAAQAGRDADLLVVEGVMGLFDGATLPRQEGEHAEDDFASAAHVARLIEAPVVLVVDASAMGHSVAALVQGFTTYDRRLRMGGVILNRVGSDHHEALLRESLRDVDTQVLGVLRRDDALRWRDRHLGLVPVVEHAEQVSASIERLASLVSSGCDLDAIYRLARGAPHLTAVPLASARPQGTARVAVAAGRAFSFAYPENLERLSQAGAELVEFDPLHDVALPDGVSGLLAGGGFPEVYAEGLAENHALLADVRSKVRAGLPTWAECGGLLWLCRSLDGHELAGVVDAHATMGDRLTLGYRRVEALVESPVAPTAAHLWGHEFHYSTLGQPGQALRLVGRTGTDLGGYATPHLLASYLHLHLGADALPAERFVAAAVAFGGDAARE